MQQRRRIPEIAIAAKLFELLGKLDNSSRPEVEAHAFQRMRMKGELAGVSDRLADLLDAFGGAFQK